MDATPLHVMLTMNMWTDFGLCNGETGTVLDFIFADNRQPPHLPIADIVQLDDYSGQSLYNEIPSSVPIYPAKATLDGVHE